MYIRKSKMKINKTVVLCFLLCISVTLGFTFYKMHPVIMKYAVSVAETIMLNSANEAVIHILDKNDVSYDDIVLLTTNDDGYVTSLEIDIYEINNLKSHISNEVSKIIEEKEHYNIGIPIGTFLGNTYTSGLGPNLNFKMQLTTTAFVNFIHEFRDAGINQVLHIVMIEMKITGNLIIVGYSKSINVSTSAIAAQTVIVGNIPDAFTTVIESETDNTGGLINDYGAIAQ